jgi:hypothetical protein
MDVVRDVVRDDYPARLKSMVEDLNMPGSFIVWFEGGGLSDSVLQEANVNLQIYRAFPDANILASSENVGNGNLP